MVPVHVEFQSSNGCNDVKYQSFNDSYDVGDDFDENGGITLMRKGGEERIQSIGWDNLTTCLWGITTDQSEEQEDDEEEDGVIVFSMSTIILTV